MQSAPAQLVSTHFNFGRRSLYQPRGPSLADLPTELLVGTSSSLAILDYLDDDSLRSVRLLARRFYNITQELFGNACRSSWRVGFDSASLARLRKSVERGKFNRFAKSLTVHLGSLDNGFLTRQNVHRTKSQILSRQTGSIIAASLARLPACRTLVFDFQNDTGTLAKWAGLLRTRLFENRGDSQWVLGQLFWLVIDKIIHNSIHLDTLKVFCSEPSHISLAVSELWVPQLSPFSMNRKFNVQSLDLTVRVTDFQHSGDRGLGAVLALMDPAPKQVTLNIIGTPSEVQNPIEAVHVHNEIVSSVLSAQGIRQFRIRPCCGFWAEHLSLVRATCRGRLEVLDVSEVFIANHYVLLDLVATLQEILEENPCLKYVDLGTHVTRIVTQNGVLCTIQITLNEDFQETGGGVLLERIKQWQYLSAAAA